MTVLSVFRLRFFRFCVLDSVGGLGGSCLHKWLHIQRKEAKGKHSVGKEPVCSVVPSICSSASEGCALRKVCKIALPQ